MLPLQMLPSLFEPLLANLIQGARLQGPIPSQSEPDLRTIQPAPDGRQRNEIRLSHQQIGQIAQGDAREGVIRDITHQQPPGLCTNPW